jgi:hypothetical protein
MVEEKHEYHGMTLVKVSKKLEELGPTWSMRLKSAIF